MSMEDLWPRQSVHGWDLFLGIKSVYNDYKQQKWKKLPRQVPRLAWVLATALIGKRCLLLFHLQQSRKRRENTSRDIG